MSEHAVEEGLDMYFDSLVSNTRDEVSPTKALSGISVRGVDDIVKSVNSQIEGEIEEIEQDIDVQTNEFLNYFEGDFDKQRFMRNNPVYSNIPEPQVAEQAEQDLIDILDNTKNNLQAVYDDETDEFYAALAKNYKQEEAENLLNSTFSQVEYLKPYFSKMEITASLDLGLFSKEIDVTDEVTRAMLSGEKDTRREIISGLRNHYAQTS